MKSKLLVMLQQIIKFGLVGVSNTLISLALYYFLVFLGCYYLIANIVGFILSVINSYFWNSKFVFKNKTENSAKKAFFKMFLSYLLTLIISSGVITLSVEVLKFSKFIAPLFSLCVTIPLNFILNKLWAFKDK